MTWNDTTGPAGTPARVDPARQQRRNLVGQTRAEFAAPRPPNGANAAQAHAEIQLAAYLRWKRSGGDAVANWLASERDARGRRAPASAPGPVNAGT